MIVVNDHSTDGTGDDRSGDRRERRATPRDRGARRCPTGWFGKQWACATGASEARGELLVFTDADTRHAPDLLAARRQRDA